jgi:2-dehydropantoate 2-reductase
MRIAVYGTGGAGGFFGAKLARAGEDVVFIARGEHLRAIRSRGLHVETPSGEILIHPAQATDDPAQVEKVDVVLLGVKAWQVRDAANAMRPMFGAETFVVPLQNGVEAAAHAAVLGADHVLGGLCGTFSWVAEPGRIRNIGAINYVKLGELDNRQSERAERLRAALERAGVKAEVSSDVRRVLWEKFMMVTSFGGMGAVTRAPIGIIRALPETRQKLEQCVREVDTVARAHEVVLADSAIADIMAFFDSMAENATTSLQRDIAEGKPSELEAWNGAVVRLAKERGVDTPAHELIYYSLLPLELRARGKLAFST